MKTKVKEELSDTDFVKTAKALSDKSRVEILRQIVARGSLTCTEAQGVCNLAQPTVSHHIKQLIDSGLVTAEKTGRVLTLKANRKYIKAFMAFVGDDMLKKKPSV